MQWLETYWKFKWLEVWLRFIPNYTRKVEKKIISQDTIEAETHDILRVEARKIQNWFELLFKHHP